MNFEESIYSEASYDDANWSVIRMGALSMEQSTRITPKILSETNRPAVQPTAQSTNISTMTEKWASKPAQMGSTSKCAREQAIVCMSKQ